MRVLVCCASCLIAARVAAADGLAPNTWTAEERERYQLLSLIYDFPKPLAAGEHGMIGGTSGPVAVHAGLCVLQQDGSAADACIATALAQIVLTAGSWNSFAGVLYMVYLAS